MSAQTPYRDAWTTVRCQVTVRRADHGWSTEETTYRDEPCGLPAKALVTIGRREVPVCGVHRRKLEPALS